jgi:phage terminase large subunit GpA-like protein
MEWENVKWEEGKTETAWLECIHCHEKIEERHKFKIVTDGQWIATNPEHPNKRRHGYHLSALYSTLGYTWANVVDKYIKAKGDDNKMRAWYNTNLGLCWKENIEVPDWTMLYSRREWYQFNQPPAHAAFLTAGVDVQKDRIEVEIVAWCKNKVSYSIDYRVINGDITNQETKDKLSALLNETWERDDGALMKLHLMAIDTGYNTNEVYTFCNAHPATRVVPIKGREELSTIYGIPRSIEVARNGKAIGKVKVWGVGVSVIKNELYGWLRAVKKDQKEEPLGYCHFPQHDEYYFKMITAEQLQLTQDKRGFKRYMWVLPSHARNEALDCRVYARAAASIAGMDRMREEDWDAWAGQYPNKEDAPLTQAPPKRQGGGFLGDHSGFLG